MGTKADEVNEVFDYWLATLRTSNRGLRPVLTDKRRKIIERAIGWYGVDGCKLAIDGCKSSAFHMGDNPGGKKYDSIELILRDAEHIERFAGYVTNDAKEAFYAEG